MQETRRHLPHHYAPGKPVFVTFRLHGTLPEGRSFPARSLTSGKAFVCMDRMLDEERAGPSYLKQPAIAKVVISYIAKGATYDYILHAWVLMSNHVHMLITPLVDLPALMRRLKGGSARQCNLLLSRTGPFWQDESYDRRVRGAEEFNKIENYILLNPVRAGLAHSPEDYPWSSCGLKPAAG